MAGTSTHLNSHSHSQIVKIKRRRCRETTITSTIDPTPSAAANHLQFDPHIAISPDTNPPQIHPAMGPYGGDTFPSSLSKFNSALTAGLLNPMSPPPPPDKTRSSPTLFEMMANEPDSLPRPPPPAAFENGSAALKNQQGPRLAANVDKQALMQQRLLDLLASRSPGNQFNDAASSDVVLTLSSKDGVSVSIRVHRQILVVHSRFFALKLNESWVKQQGSWVPYNVEIADCDDIEVYIETLRLMYSKDLRRKLMKEDVQRVLGILRVSVAIGFDAGVLSCLEYLEAAPWAEDEEEKVASLLSELQLEGVGAGEVLKRVSLDAATGLDDGKNSEEVLLKLLQAAHGDMQDIGQIARQADNLHWLLDIMIDRQIAENFLMTWASQSELSEAHPKVPPIHRYEVSRVTARLFVGIGKRELLASKEARCMLLKTWLVPFYEDFRWMGRASRGLDRHSIEDGLSNTISTLPMALQQEIFVSWFNRFLNGADDCPNIQRGFEVWWRRAFVRRRGEDERPHQMRIISDTMENS
ncbi:BTB/POZ domain-containing protein-like protein [Salvia divinorum]|uniref:BTB/POZ domain-containing protein-like protein n=1 Tax=Salvia divinorum TaxID=28513 RepID=A0ABD1IMY6_SALDI